MDTGSVLKPAAQKSGVRPSARPPVATELSPAKTVTAASDAAQLQTNEDARQHDLILDPHSREVIYRAVDALSGRKSSRNPEVAARRMKAYSRPLKKQPDDPDVHADIEV